MRAPAWILVLLSSIAATATSDTPADTENNLVFRRQNGEVIIFPGHGEDVRLVRSLRSRERGDPDLHVITYDTTLTDRTYWRLWAIPVDVTIGQPQLFPNHWSWPNPDSVEIFVGDPPNEAATDTEDAAGSITFQQLDCSEGGVVEFTVDARIGSEFGDGPWITVQGSLRTTLTGSPFVPARPSTWGEVKASYR